MDEYGRALRRWRRVRGVKQSHLAELLGVTQATVSRWEAGRHKPTEGEAGRLAQLLRAPLDAAGDAGLRRLVENSTLSVHLVCDLSHRLLAASPARAAEWGCGASELRGVSLWRFASPEIRAAEARLPDSGWYDGATASLTLWTGANRSDVVPILPGMLVWERLQLGDGSFARLVTTLPG